LQNPGLPHTAVQKINRSSRDSGAARRFIFFAELSFLQKKAGASYLAAAFTGVQFA